MKPEIFNTTSKNTLAAHLSRPTVVQTRQAAQWSQMSGLEPRRLARIIRDANQYEGLPEYFTLLEELEEHDGHIMAIMGTRKRTVCQMEISVEAADGDKKYQSHADLVEEFVNRDDLDDILFDMLDAIGKGYSITEVLWETSESQWMPASLVRADPRFFAIDKDDGETLRLMRDGNELEDLAPYKFIVHNAPAKSGSPIRGAVLRPCLWMSLFKNYQLKDWVIFNEAYNQPMRLGKYHAGASDAEKATLLRAVHNIGADAGAIIPENMHLEFVEAAAKASSEKSYKSLIDLCDLQCSKAVLGQTTTTDAVSGGHAVAKEHNEVRRDISVSDAKKLAARLNKTIVRWIIDFNFGPQLKYPTISIGLSEEIDQEQFGKNAERGMRLGIKMSASGIAEKLGLPVPENDDDVIGGTVKPEPPPPVKKDVATATAAAQDKPRSTDAVENIADDLASDYEVVIDPFRAAIQQAADQSTSYDEFNQRLLEIADDLDINGVADKIAQANFWMNIAGQVDAKIKP